MSINPSDDEVASALPPPHPVTRSAAVSPSAVMSFIPALYRMAPLEEIDAFVSGE
jgi:hypothetical protein